MSLPPLADLPAFEEWLGRALAEDEQARAGAVLNAASSLVRSEAGQTWTDGGGQLTEVPTDVQTVTLEVARRVFTNPSGFQSERIGDYSYSFPTEGPGGLRLTTDERAMLARYRPSQRGLWTLGTTRHDPAADTAYVPVEGTTTPFPWYGGDV